MYFALKFRECRQRLPFQQLKESSRQRTQGTQGMIEGAKRPARPPSEEDEDEDEDSQERPRGNRKETLYQKGGQNIHSGFV